MRDRLAARRGRGTGARSAASGRASCSSRSTTATGIRRRGLAGRYGRPRGQRADDHGLGPGVQAAAVQGRRGPHRTSGGELRCSSRHYLGLLHRSQVELADALRTSRTAHADEVDVFHICPAPRRQCDAHAARWSRSPSATARTPTTSRTGCTPSSSGQPRRSARPAARPPRPLPDGASATSRGRWSARPRRGSATPTCWPSSGRARARRPARSRGCGHG